jgi:hypothetical protein
MVYRCSNVFSDNITFLNIARVSQRRCRPEGIGRISELTADFSFAYLKELFLSSMMQWIATPGQSTMEQVMMGKVATLREQMVSGYTLDDGEIDNEPPRPVRRFRGSPKRPSCT